MISELRAISMEFCPGPEAEPITISRDEDVKAATERLIEIKRTIDEVTIILTEQLKVKVKKGIKN